MAFHEVVTPASTSSCSGFCTFCDKDAPIPRPPPAAENNRICSSEFVIKGRSLFVMVPSDLRDVILLPSKAHAVPAAAGVVQVSTPVPSLVIIVFAAPCAVGSVIP